MAAILTTPIPITTLAELLSHLGDIPPYRIRVLPAPGTATEQDVLAIYTREKRLCELVDGVLVEKAMGFRESCLALALSAALRAFVRPRNLGLVSGADGLMRLLPGLVRIPDVAFLSWERLPGRRMPTAPIPDVVPDLVVEVLSAGNTPAEMSRKRQEYFTSGVRLLWIIDPDTHTVQVWTAVEQSFVLHAAQTLDGGEVLPGFTFPLQELFAELDLQENV